MKKWVSMLLAVLMLFSFASAEEDQTGVLDIQEVQQVFSEALAQILQAENLDVWDEDGTVCYGTKERFLVLAEGEEPSIDTEVLRFVSITGDEMHEIAVGDPLEKVINAFRCDNPSLRGTEYSALIYMEGDLSIDGKVLVGYVSREGQRNDLIVYESLTGSEDGKQVYAFGVRYLTRGDTVSSVEYFKETMEADEAAALLDELALSQEEGAFSPAVNVAVQMDRAMFGTEDLIFSGINMTDCTIEEIISVLGTPEADNWVQDGEDMLRICQFPGAEAVAIYSGDRAFRKVYSLKITEGTAGPRDVRIGDGVRSVRNRFYFDNEVGLLYGNGAGLPCGTLTSVDSAIVIRYACEAGGSMAELSLRFEEGVLVEILVTMD